MASVTFDKASRIYPGTSVPAVDALDLTIDDGELTPTLKVKRRIVNANWEAEIEAMYDN